MVRNARPVGRVDVGLLAQRLERLPGLLEVTNTGQYVDDRFRGEPGNGSRADVVDAAVEPWGEHSLQQCTFDLEAVWPLRVVWNDDDQPVRHRRSVSPALQRARA